MDTGRPWEWMVAATSSLRYPATTTIRVTPASHSTLTVRSSRVTPPTRRSTVGWSERDRCFDSAVATTALVTRGWGAVSGRGSMAGSMRQHARMRAGARMRGDVFPHLKRFFERSYGSLLREMTASM